MTAADKVKYLYDFLDKKNFDQYNYRLNRVNYYNGELCYIISFYPKTQKKAVHQNISKKMNYAIFAGNLYIGINTFAIVGFECQTSNIADFRIYEKHLPFKTEVKVDYQKKDTKWYLAKIKTNQIHRLKHKNKTILYECDRELVVNNIITNNVLPFNNREQLLEQKNYATIRFFSDIYKEKIWEKLSQQKHYPTLNTKAKKDLETNQPLKVQFKERFNQKTLEPPKFNREISYIYLHGDTLIDAYKGLEKSNPKTIQYLKEENKYFRNYMISSRKGRKRYHHIVNLIVKEDTARYPYVINDFAYFWDDSSTDFPVLYRKNEAGTKEFVLDVSTQIQGTNQYLTKYEISPNNQIIAFSLGNIDSVGHTVYVQKVGNNQMISKVHKVDDFKWFGNQIITYSSQNNQRRVNKLHAYHINQQEDVLLFEEKDTTYELNIDLDKAQKYLLVTSESLDETEIRFARIQEGIPKLTTFLPRIKGHKYSIFPEEKRFLILTNWKAPNFRLMETPITNTSARYLG